ncbi:MAG: hypothetical protein TQ37_01300 [Candidatus Synechococcus spongiarum 15L]|uniref:Uncharacterized protein n=1 Tax=Candidatus Synechococcus spongiarum 15L TaxID=1608419 RepID=A0A0G8AYK3_9SYNE|nr:MAG: hypothetical protein TQ37_01300 [Candidatus Synechococcus spongiarum 15L]
MVLAGSRITGVSNENAPPRAAAPIPEAGTRHEVMETRCVRRWRLFLQQQKQPVRQFPLAQGPGTPFFNEREQKALPLNHAVLPSSS